MMNFQDEINSNDDTISELKLLLNSSKMSNFTLACNKLIEIDSISSFEMIKSFINDKDKFKRLYVLKIIFKSQFSNPLSDDLRSFLEESISSDDLLFVRQGLLIVAENNVSVSEELVFTAVSENLSELYTEIYALKIISETESNFQKMIELFKKSRTSSQKEFMADILINKFYNNHAEDMFSLFSDDENAKIRLFAIKLGKIHGYDISKFKSDINGHVRKAATNQ